MISKGGICIITHNSSPPQKLSKRLQARRRRDLRPLNESLRHKLPTVSCSTGTKVRACVIFTGSQNNDIRDEWFRNQSLKRMNSGRTHSQLYDTSSQLATSNDIFLLNFLTKKKKKKKKRNKIETARRRQLEMIIIEQYHYWEVSFAERAREKSCDLTLLPNASAKQ